MARRNQAGKTTPKPRRTRHKLIKNWPENHAGDGVRANAILDRLLRRSQLLDIKSRSYRLRDLEWAVAGA
jgi:IstB-like ATP binding protein